MGGAGHEVASCCKKRIIPASRAVICVRRSAGIGASTRGSEDGGRFDTAGAFRPGLHPGGHPAPEKKRLTITFTVAKRRAQDLAAETLVVGNPIGASSLLAWRLAQRRFFDGAVSGARYFADAPSYRSVPGSAAPVPLAEPKVLSGASLG